MIFSVSGDGEIRTLDRSQLDALEEFVSNICEDRIDPPLSFFTRRLPLPDRRSVLLVTVEGSALVHKSPGGFLTRKGSTVASCLHRTCNGCSSSVAALACSVPTSGS